MCTVNSCYFVEKAICEQAAVSSFSQSVAALNFCSAVDLACILPVHPLNPLRCVSFFIYCYQYVVAGRIEHN